MTALQHHTRQFFIARKAARLGDVSAIRWLSQLAAGKLGQSPCMGAARKTLDSLGAKRKNA